MITSETAMKIWQSHREIASARKLLEDMAKLKEDYPRDQHAKQLKDVFGDRQSLQLGIPCGKSGHQLYRVNPDLAKSVIRAHIADKERELVEANEQARIEVDI